MTDEQIQELETLLCSLLNGEHSSLTLSFNEDAAPNHMTVAQAVEAGCDDATSWISEEQKQKAIRENRMWTLHWYPETPIGFISLSGADLGAVLKAATK